MRHIFLLDSISAVNAAQAGQIIVSGSHGGVSAARFVLEETARPHAVFFNDAGVGKDDAGIVGLTMVQTVHVIGATYSHRSARIGDAADGLANGTLSHLNSLAIAAGLRAGMPICEAVRLLGAEPGAAR